jgi:hypothetical protein
MPGPELAITKYISPMSLHHSQAGLAASCTEKLPLAGVY